MPSAHAKLFEMFGLSDHEAKVYLHLLRNGAASIREIAGDTGVNRGTVYEALKSLADKGLVSHSADASRRRFAAEDPSSFRVLVDEAEERAATMRSELARALPDLSALYGAERARPAIRIHEGHKGTKVILEDVLRTVGKEPDRTYRVYSAANIREYLYYNLASFSARRIKAKIKARVIAIGAGGEVRGLDERRWITSKKGAPAYVIIYGRKMAIISLAEGRPHSVVIEDAGLAETQKLVFDSLWGKLAAE